MDKVIFAGRLLGMSDPFVSDNMVLYLKNNKISEIHKGNQFSPPAGVQVFDWGECTVMPGLIDCHDHLGIDAGDERAQAFESDFVNILRGVRNAASLLKSGITTLRNLGDKNFMDIYWKKAIDAGWIIGPRLVNSCQLIAKTGGHAWYLGIEADGADGLRSAIRKQVKAGADVIKIMITGGVGTEGSDPMMAEFSDGEIIAAIEEAHRCNRKIAAHAHGGPAIKCAVQNGMDSIEHGVYLTEDEIKLMSEKGTYLVVTYGILSAASKLPHIPEFMRKKAEETLEHYPKTISLAKKHGLNVVFGGDTYHADPKAELEALVDAGFSPEDALKAGTVNAAKLLGMEDKVGSISIGKFADLIVLKGDPSKNIQDIANIICVIKDGHVYYSNKPKD